MHNERGLEISKMMGEAWISAGARHSPEVSVEIIQKLQQQFECSVFRCSWCNERRPRVRRFRSGGGNALEWVACVLLGGEMRQEGEGQEGDVSGKWTSTNGLTLARACSAS